VAQGDGNVVATVGKGGSSGDGAQLHKLLSPARLHRRSFVCIEASWAYQVNPPVVTEIDVPGR
jgi:hypothetical protein